MGVCFLIAAKILELESFSVLLGQLGMYFLTVLIGLTVHGFFVLLLLYTLVVRKLPFSFVANIIQPLATAFGTSSRSVTAPGVGFMLWASMTFSNFGSNMVEWGTTSSMLMPFNMHSLNKLKLGMALYVTYGL